MATTVVEATPTRSTRTTPNTYVLQPDGTVSISIYSRRYGPFAVLVDVEDVASLVPLAACSWGLKRSADSHE
jgi:hypothetical protein